MVLVIGIKILGIHVGKLQKGQGSYCRTAGVEEIDHGLTLRIEAHTVVALHPAGDALVIPSGEIDEMAVGSFNDCLTP